MYELNSQENLGSNLNFWKNDLTIRIYTEQKRYPIHPVEGFPDDQDHIVTVTKVEYLPGTDRRRITRTCACRYKWTFDTDGNKIVSPLPKHAFQIWVEVTSKFGIPKWAVFANKTYTNKVDAEDYKQLGFTVEVR